MTVQNEKFVNVKIYFLIQLILNFTLSFFTLIFAF